MGNGMLLIPLLVINSHTWHTRFFVDRSLLNFVFPFQTWTVGQQ
jgi:hypothetical protein